MKIVRGLFIGLIVFILLIGVVGFFLPSEAHVERSTVIKATPAEVYDVIIDFEQFNDWSPWHDLDPDARYEYSGGNRVIGSSFAWFSDKPEVGNGRQTITSMETNQSVVMRLEFEGQDPADSFFTLTPTAEGTDVVWGFDTDLGANPYLHYLSLFMDTFLGPSYEDGLRRLKTYVESKP
ncbi:MAG: SRPBCC family protein [Gammaproteobacteria bacterium]